MYALFFCVSEGKGSQGLSQLPFATIPLSTYLSTARLPTSVFKRMISFALNIHTDHVFFAS